jgi:ABC-2 type transport system permease protein
MLWWLIGTPPPASGWPLVIITMLGAWTLNFCIAAMIGLAAFVVEDISAFQWIYQKLAFILGGLLIPLDFYPGWLQNICRALPFSSITYAPARLFVSPSISAFAGVFGLQIVWIVILGLLLTFTYKRSLTQLTVNGG